MGGYAHTSPWTVQNAMSTPIQACDLIRQKRKHFTRLSGKVSRAVHVYEDSEAMALALWSVNA